MLHRHTMAQRLYCPVCGKIVEAFVETKLPNSQRHLATFFHYDENETLTECRVDKNRLGEMRAHRSEFDSCCEDLRETLDRGGPLSMGVVFDGSTGVMVLDTEEPEKQSGRVPHK